MRVNSILAADTISDAERIPEVSIFSSTGAADVNVKGFLFDIHNYRLHCSSFFLLVSGGANAEFLSSSFSPSPFHWDLDVSVLRGGAGFRFGSPAAGHTRATNRVKSLTCPFEFICV
jgi:hypothetical protein